MLSHKRFRKLDKQISKDNLFDTQEDCVDINIKVENKSQIFSSYNYDDDTLNKELGDYLWDRAKLVPMKKDINVKIYTNQQVEAKEVKRAIQSHLKSDYVETKEQLKKTGEVALVTLLLGVFFLVFFLLFSQLSVHFILITITEIMAWVFVWEAVDCFAFRRTRLKNQQLRILKLYVAQVEVIQNKN